MPFRSAGKYIAVMVLLLSGSHFTGKAFAADGSSGCGPGWYVFKQNTLVSSALRATTNGILSPVVTLGMTFGTSNCAAHKLVQQRPEALELVTFAYHDLLIQSAQAEGQHLAAYTHALGCEWQAQADAIKTIQANYETIFPSDATPPADVVVSTIEVLRNKPALANACGLQVG